MDSARTSERAIENSPLYTIFGAIDVIPPWFPDVGERKNSFDYWSKNSRQAMRKLGPKELPPPVVVVVPSAFPDGWGMMFRFSDFGGLCAQLNSVAIVLNLCVGESVDLRLTFVKIPSSRLEESARMRIFAPNDFPRLLDSEKLDVKEQARRELSLSFRSDAP